MATLSLLEVSARGLLETELLVMLADYDNLMPQVKGGEKRESRAVYLHHCIQLLIKTFSFSTFNSQDQKVDNY